MEKQVLVQSLILLDKVGQNPINTNLRSHIKFVVMISMIFLYTGLLLTELSLTFGFDSLARAFEILPILYQEISRFFVVLSRRRQMLKIVKNSERFWPVEKFGKNDEGILLLKLIWFLSISFRVSSILLIAIYMISPLVLGKKTLPFMSYGEHNGLVFPYYEMSYFLQFCTCYVLYFSIQGFDGLFFYFMAQVTVQLKMLKRAVSQPKGLSTENIEYHNFILQFVKDLDDIYSNVMLNQYLVIQIELCFAYFLLTMNGISSVAVFLRYTTYLLACIIQTFTYCLLGAQMSDAGADISDAVFHSIWVNTDTKIDKIAALMIIQQSQIPVNVTIGRFANLDLEFFLVIFKQAMSYLTFIQTMYND